MDFYIERRRDAFGTQVFFKGWISETDLVSLRLDPLDRALLEDIGQGEGVTSADYLLALEMLFRRQAEQRQKEGA